jgi:hypothetical protein
LLEFWTVEYGFGWFVVWRVWDLLPSPPSSNAKYKIDFKGYCAGFNGFSHKMAAPAWISRQNVPICI